MTIDTDPMYLRCVVDHISKLAPYTSDSGRDAIIGNLCGIITACANRIEELEAPKKPMIDWDHYEMFLEQVKEAEKSGRVWHTEFNRGTAWRKILLEVCGPMPGCRYRIVYDTV